ncbi:MAG: ATP-binding protein [Clostridia bacterium]|nr:ATP-binding protein [Clostridia bacterium]MBR2413103.1 ATP-binding protein [Clostridia bacterium]
MKELSLNILDIAQNSIKAGADTIKIELTESGNRFEIRITDNGCGMKEDFVRNVTDPFTTTRTTRKVGLGIPLFKLAAEQTGGKLTISSKHESEHPQDHGTVVTAVFDPTHMDFTPLGDIASTLTILIQGSPDIHWIYTHSKDNGSVSLDTDELKAVLGDVPLDTFEVLAWIGNYIKEQYSGL